MKPITPGYLYELNKRDNSEVTQLQFVERVPEGRSSIVAASADGKIVKENKTPRAMTTKVNGVTTEEVLAACLHRLIHLQHTLGHVDTFLAAHHLELAITHLNNRTQDRMTRGVEGTAKS